MPKLNQQEGMLPLGDGTSVFHNVLCATDLSTATDQVCEYAFGIAKQHGANLLMVHVIAPNTYDAVPPSLIEKARQQNRLEAENELKHLRRLHGRSARAVELLVREGQICETILQLISEREVDLLIVGTRAHREVKRLLLGSMAEKLFRQASCPVLVVPDRVWPEADAGQSFGRIVCATDFSQGSVAAFEYAAAIARRHSSYLIMLHVVNAEQTAKGAARGERDLTEELRRILPAGFELPSGTRFKDAMGDPARNISRVAAENQADLVVIAVNPADQTAAHEAEGTADRLMPWLHCPVLTVPKSASPRHMRASTRAA